MKLRNTILFVLLFVAASINAQTLTVEITNIRNNKGKILLAVFKNNDSFKKEEPFLEKSYHKKSLKTGKITVKIQLEQGTYGITILDDENNDGKMKYNLIRIPKEGYGFSNYFHTGISRPKLDNFKFIVGDKDKTVHVKMKYF
ncbi:MAG: hypothetical protein DRI95_12465 [Bacteroidetes bacterium]|nr:MAG: hypothetical protein DRI95_12465 [Bacteroidota bacterium]RLD75524.1 MAG: hypothetical protein DRJ07_17915 [Bacteroidota bacterium]